MATGAGEGVRAFISVGSNIDPEANLPRGLGLLAARVEVCGVSTFYRTAPIGPPGQEEFVNGVCSVRTALSAAALKEKVLRVVEAELGRVRTENRYAARPIDLDLIVHGEVVVDRDDLLRPFVLAGIAELEPNLRLPGEREPLSCTFSAPASAATMTPLPDLTQRLIESVSA